MSTEFSTASDGLHTAAAAVSIGLVAHFVRETKGRTLEQM
jgi:hypothetical protein